MSVRRRAFVRLAAVAPLAALVLLPVGTPVAAQDLVEDDPSAQYRVSSEEALAADAEAFASHYGFSVEEGSRAVVAQDLYAKWLAKVVDSTSAYSTSQLHLKSMTAKVWFTTVPAPLQVPPLVGCRWSWSVVQQ